MEPGTIFFVLSIIAMVMLTKIITTAIRARHGYPLAGPHGRRLDRRDGGADIRAENEQLKGMIVRLEDRLATLERIATDQPNRLSAEIERLR